jgi:hypothetical protein
VTKGVYMPAHEVIKTYGAIGGRIRSPYSRDVATL